MRHFLPLYSHFNNNKTSSTRQDKKKNILWFCESKHEVEHLIKFSIVSGDSDNEQRAFEVARWLVIFFFNVAFVNKMVIKLLTFGLLSYYVSELEGGMISKKKKKKIFPDRSEANWEEYL